MDSVQIARVAHKVNKAYCESLGDDSQLDWDAAPEWQTKSAIVGVEFHRNNPEAGPEASHLKWMEEKTLDGWKYGPVKDPIKKEHPCYQDYRLLPKEQQAKDFIFRAIVHALKDEEVASASIVDSSTVTS